MRDDSNVLDLLTADYTYITERLVNFYQLEGKLPGVRGNQPQLVKWPDNRRAGVMNSGAVMAITAGVVFARGISDIGILAGVFALAGIVAGVEDTLEGATTADYALPETRGTAFGVLGIVNGAGDLVSSLIVGALWLANPMLGFGYAALMMAAGAVVVSRAR